MESATPGGNQQTPEVEAGIALEAIPYPDLQLNCVDPGDGGEGGDGHRRG